MVEKIVKYDDKTLKDYFKFHFKKTNIIMLVCGAIVLLSGIVYMLCNKYLLGALTCVAGVLFMCFPFIIIAMSLGQNRKALDTTEKFEFGDTEFKVQSERFGEIIANATNKYSNLECIKENDQYLFIYLNKVSAIPLKKSNLTKEEYTFIVEHISEALKTKDKNKV